MSGRDIAADWAECGKRNAKLVGRSSWSTRNFWVTAPGGIVEHIGPIYRNFGIVPTKSLEDDGVYSVYLLDKGLLLADGVRAPDDNALKEVLEIIDAMADWTFSNPKDVPSADLTMWKQLHKIVHPEEHKSPNDAASESAWRPAVASQRKA